MMLSNPSSERSESNGSQTYCVDPVISADFDVAGIEFQSSTETIFKLVVYEIGDNVVSQVHVGLGYKTFEELPHPGPTDDLVIDVEFESAKCPDALTALWKGVEGLERIMDLYGFDSLMLISLDLSDPSYTEVGIAIAERYATPISDLGDLRYDGSYSPFKDDDPIDSLGI